MTEMRLKSIGVIRSSHQEATKTPIQPIYAQGGSGWVEIWPEYKAGLKDLEGFSHLILVYYFHRAGPPRMRVRPFLDRTPRGLFATRHPDRPNPIGLSVVRLTGIQGCKLSVDGVDVLDGTPLLDIKPYVPRFDGVAGERGGWTEALDPAEAERLGRREGT